MSLWEWETCVRGACILATGGIGNLHVVVLVGRIIGVTVNKTIEAVDLQSLQLFVNH